MTFSNIFQPDVSQQLVDRINKLSPDTKAQWGKMNVAQMLRHCNIPYELVYEPANFKKPNALTKMMSRLIIKKIVLGDKPYPKNGRTASVFIVAADQDFEKEKQQLISNIWRMQQDGATTFDGKESHSMGNLSAAEWSTMFYKHLDHHLMQFGV